MASTRLLVLVALVATVVTTVDAWINQSITGSYEGDKGTLPLFLLVLGVVFLVFLLVFIIYLYYLARRRGQKSPRETEVPQI
ncbi:hypothetical protein RND81_04G233800 [Saponaria officinalis]|uniref:Uncharacterized protein n=1 Tax=Saponaria officinalis TaxID=3572 RepID=A0AAW1LGD9_SAPOF